MNHIKFLSICLSLLIFLDGCTSTSTDIRITQTKEGMVEYNETVHSNNCGGKANVTQMASHSFTTNIDGIIAGKVGPDALQASVASQYGQYRNESKNIELIAPPGTNMQFTLKWTERMLQGVVFVSNDEGTYEAHVPVSVELVGSEDLKCFDQSPIAPAATEPLPPRPQPIATQPQPTIVPVPTLSYAEKLCPVGIKQSGVDALKIGVTDAATAKSQVAKFDSERIGDAGTFTANTLIPAGVLIATNFDERDPNKWTQYPVVPIARSGSYGLFQTVGEYTAPNTGACRIITP